MGTRGGIYKWLVVAMLWCVCLFNYADRQAIFSVFPLLKRQFGLSDLQLGYIGSSFMWVYALAAPFAGLIADRLPRKTVILSGLSFWSLITLATALSTTYWQLLTFRALEGLGEAFYFPASMSMLSSYHGPDTRSRAMSWHQSSVYAGTIAGGALAGWLAERYGWRCGFYVFGSGGILLGMLLLALLKEPETRGVSEGHGVFDLRDAGRAIFGNPAVLVLMAVFVGANFVAMIYLTWLPSYLNRQFGMNLAMAGFNATAYLQVASVLGVLSGGALADRLARTHRGGRMMTQALGLFAGVPFLLFSGATRQVSGFVIAMTGFGFFKGIYDANIWASLHDVVPVERRASAVGVMNSVGWLGGGFAPIAIGAASGHYGMGVCLSATSAIYLSFGLLLTAGVLRYLRGAPRPSLAASAR